MADRLFEPVDAFLIERAAAVERLDQAERLVVVDHDRDPLTDARLHRVERREILRERRIAEPQLQGAEARIEQLVRFVRELVRRHQPEPAGIVGGDALGVGAQHLREPQPRGLRERVPRRHVEARHRHAHDALHADQGEALGEPGPQVERRDALALGHTRDLLEDLRDRRHGGGEIAPEIGAAGDALLGLEIDQQQRRLGDGAAAGAERIGHRHLDRDGADAADRQEWRRRAHARAYRVAVRLEKRPRSWHTLAFARAGRRSGGVMQGKVTLEDHFATKTTLADSEIFGAHVWHTLGPNLIDFQEQRLRAMDAAGIEIMAVSYTHLDVYKIAQHGGLLRPAAISPVLAHGRKPRRAVLSASAQSAAGRDPGLRGPSLAARAELGLPCRDRRARFAADRLRAVRRAPEAADHPRPSRRRAAVLHLAHRQPERLDEGAAHIRRTQERGRLLPRQFPCHHVGPFQHARARRCGGRARRRTRDVLGRLSVRGLQPGRQMVRCGRDPGRRPAEDRPHQRAEAVQAEGCLISLVARMERSEIRGPSPQQASPAFRFAPCGLRTTAVPPRAESKYPARRGSAGSARRL